MKPARLLMALAPAAVLAWGSVAWAAAPPPDEVCLAGKEVAAGEYAECRLKAEATFVLTDWLEDYEKAIVECNERLVEKFALVESQANGDCPTVGDAEAMLAMITGYTNNIAAALSGGAITVCGNGVLEPGEECEWGTMGEATCASVTGAWRPRGDLKCNVGTCTLDASDCFDTCGGAVVDGRCWILGEPHEPCTCVCGDHWGHYSEETVMAGSAGTDEVCGAILDALGVPPGPVVAVAIPEQGDGIDYGLGCGYHEMEGVRYRVTSPTTTGPATAFEHVDISRACACSPLAW